MLRASVLVAMLAVALPTGWRWWQQHAALNDRGTVLEVRLDPSTFAHLPALMHAYPMLRCLLGCVKRP